MANQKKNIFFLSICILIYTMYLSICILSIFVYIYLSTCILYLYTIHLYTIYLPIFILSIFGYIYLPICILSIYILYLRLVPSWTRRLDEAHSIRCGSRRTILPHSSGLSFIQLYTIRLLLVLLFTIFKKSFFSFCIFFAIFCVIIVKIGWSYSKKCNCVYIFPYRFICKVHIQLPTLSLRKGGGGKKWKEYTPGVVTVSH